MRGGGNITDISQLNGIKLISSYWSKVDERCENANYVFVGDVHGDLHQFLAPLVLNDVIKLTGKLDVKDENIYYYIPNYEINNNCMCKVIYLGDIVDEWLFSRTIAFMVYKLLKKKMIIFIYGNHDLSIIGRYHLFKQHKLNIAEDIPPLWETLKKELNCIKEIKIYKNIILYDNDEEKGKEFLYKYLEPLFDNLYKIFSKQLGKLSLAVSINNIQYIVSHSTWSKYSIRQLLQPAKPVENAVRQGDKEESQLKQIIDNYKPSPESLKYLSSICRNENSNEIIDYVKLSNSCNDVFNSKSRLFISKNNLTYSRSVENIFLNQITGHTFGSEFRELNINVKPSTFYKERLEKIKPDIINGCKIFYFDFGASAGYDHDEISRPDFVYITKDGMYVTNLPGFSFIISKSIDENSNENDKDSLLIMKDKTTKSKNKIVWH